MKRRDFVALTAAAALPAAFASSPPAADPRQAEAHLRAACAMAAPRYCLNMSTLRGHNLSVPEQVRIAATAGYDAIEPWIRDLQRFVGEGGKLAELKQQIEDAGLSVESAIGFAQWIVDDPAARQAALEEARRDMDLLRQIGGKRIAAPPVGAHTAAGPSLDAIAQRYRALLELGRQHGVTPQLELWGFSQTLSRLSELAYVAVAAEHPDACVLPDFYHIYKGGSDFAGLGMIQATRMHVFHINDYPADSPRATIQDADRVFPGDGVCPLVDTIAMLLRGGFAGTFSLELFNPEYWKRDPQQVAAEGLAKTRAVVAAAVQRV